MQTVLAVLAICVCSLTGAHAQQPDSTLQQTVGAVIENEESAAKTQEVVAYRSFERSDRTGQHLWEERAIDLPDGRLLRLVAVDGKPLSPEQNAAEIARLKGIAASPADWVKAEQARRGDRQHLQQILELLRNAFVFNPEGRDGTLQRIAYRGLPTYQPKTFEERVLWSMRGTVMVDTAAMRLRKVDGRLDQDVSLGYGLLATIRAGSSFSTERAPIPDGTWKSTTIDTEIRGRAIFFKTISRNDHAVHKEFRVLAQTTTLQEAVELLREQ